MVEAVNREFQPLQADLRAEVNRLGGDTTSTDAGYQVMREDRVVLCENSAAITVTLPPAEDVAGRWLTVKRLDAAVTVAAQAGETIDGSASFVLASQYDRVTLLSDGISFYVMGE